jgi:hypothetical protein
MSRMNRQMSQMNISKNHQRMVQIIFLMFSFIANPQVEGHVLSGMPVKLQNCICLSNYECHCYKCSWDIHFNFPSINVNIGQSQQCEAGYLTLISFLIFFFFFSLFWCRLARGQSKGGECKGATGWSPTVWL